jgi:predicted permease
MKRLGLWIISRVTPAADRESVAGDTLERYDEIAAANGAGRARRWLWREAGRVVWGAPAHWLAARPARWRQVRRSRSSAMSSIWQDVRYAARWFRRAPGFTAIAVTTLALGIGANTAMFAVVNAVMLKPLPFADADRLMLVHLLAPRPTPDHQGPAEVVWSYPKYETFTELQREFEESALFTGREFSLSGDGDPERVPGEVITASYLSVLGVRPVLGRGFTAEEATRPGLPPVAMLGHGLWTRRYGGDPNVVGRTIRLAGVAHTVVGILPRGFHGLGGNADVWTPLAVSEPDMVDREHAWDSHSYTLVAKRRGDVSADQALAALAVYGPRIDATSRKESNGSSWSATARSLQNSRIDADLRRLSLVVLGAVGFVLLIACVNLTNLLIARSLTRRREVAIRMALGAGRWRIARQLGVESLLLAATGALAGLVVAVGLLHIASIVLPDSSVFFRASIAPGTPRIPGAAGLTRIGATMIGLDGLTLVFTAGLTIFTAVAVSLLPSLQTSVLRPFLVLKAAAATASGRGHGGLGPRAILVGAEIALALVLLASAGLMIKSAMRLYDRPIGVDPANVLTAQISLGERRYTPEVALAFQDELLRRLRRVAGVESAGWGFCAPVGGGCNRTGLWLRDRPGDGQQRLTGVTWASPGFFETMRIPLIAGRFFTDDDRRDRPKVVLVNETAARMYWLGESPVGRRIGVGQGGFSDGAEVVGIVGDVRYSTIEGDPGPFVYLPLSQSHRAGVLLVVRSQLGTGALVSAISREVRDLDPNLPLTTIKTMSDRVGDAMWRTRVASWLLSGFGALALLLTAIGVFGVMAQLVAQRTAEIGIRMALGARRRDVVGLVLGRAVVVTGAGLAAGLAASVAVTRALATLLYEVTPTDPLTLGTVALVLGIVSLAACYVPVRRAIRVEAVTALRSE